MGLAINNLTAGKYWGLRRLANHDGHFTMLAVDQRPPIKNAVAQARGEHEPRAEDVQNVKRSLIKHLGTDASAVLADPHWALASALEVADPSAGLIVTLEDSLFTDTPQGRLSNSIPNWSVEKIKRVGGDAVKVLVWYRPDAGKDVIDKQKAWAQAVGEACQRYDLPYIFELLLYPFPHEDGATTAYIENPNKHPEMVIQSVEDFADPQFGIDVFKLESPLPAVSLPDKPSEETLSWFHELHRAAGRPWVMLSAGADASSFTNVLTHAYAAGANGFLAGRAVWADALKRWPDKKAFNAALAGPARANLQHFMTQTKAQASPWHQHEGYGSDGAQLAATKLAMQDHTVGFV